VHRTGGREVDARADEFFAVFERAAAALEAALEIDGLRGRRKGCGSCRLQRGLSISYRAVRLSGATGVDLEP
jgi:hypothetical protein